MNSKSLTLLALLAALVATGSAPAQSAPTSIPLELRARFGFVGPLIHKVGNGINRLLVGDITGDGRPEAVAYDGRRARLVAIHVDDGSTSMTAIPTGGQIGGYTLADIDGDGRSRILIVDARGRLSVRNLDGSEATTPRDLGMGRRGLGLFPGDLDGDGKQDLVVLAQGKMRAITGIASKLRMTPTEPTEGNVYNLHLTDLNADGKLDLLCIVPGESMNLRMRFGRGDGTFGAWRIDTVDDLSAIWPTTLGDDSAAIAAIEGSTRRVALRSLGEHGSQSPPQWWAFGDDEGTGTPPFAVGDYDHDGDDDLVLFPANRAQMVIYRYADGTFTRRELPSLAGVGSVAFGDVDGDGKLDLVMASAEEEAVAWCPGNRPIDEFPRQLPSVEKPVAVAVAPDGGVLVLSRDRRRNANLHRTAPDSEAELLLDLGRMPADPARLLASDVGDREGLEVSFVVPGEGLRTVTIAAADKGKTVTAATAGFTRKMDDGALSLSTSTDKPTLIAARERFVRRFRFRDNDQVHVLAQDNGPEGIDELTLACEVGDGGWFYYDKKQNKLVFTRPGQPLASAELPAKGFTHLIAHDGAALLLGKSGLLRVSFADGPTLRAVATHEPPTERTYYWYGDSGDFDNDGIRDLAVIDRRLPGVQILAGTGTGLARALAVPVFETRPLERPDSEPAALATGDLTGDGLCDFVLIAHDRILIYPQDK